MMNIGVLILGLLTITYGLVTYNKENVFSKLYGLDGNDKCLDKKNVLVFTLAFLFISYGVIGFVLPLRPITVIFVPVLFHVVMVCVKISLYFEEE